MQIKFLHCYQVILNLIVYQTSICFRRKVWIFESYNLNIFFSKPATQF